MFQKKIRTAFFVSLMVSGGFYLFSATTTQAMSDYRQSWGSTVAEGSFESQYIPHLVEALRTKDSEYLKRILFDERSSFPVRVGYRGHKEIWVDSPDQLYTLFVNDAFLEAFSSEFLITRAYGRHTAYEDALLAYSLDRQIGLFFYLSDFSPLMFINNTVPVPSFDCELAEQETEKVICSESTLANLDYLMSESYAKAKNYTVGEIKKELIKNQISFLGERDQCGAEFACIRERMIEQERQIQERLSYQRENHDLSVFSPRRFGTLLNGHWLTGEYVDSNSGGKASFDNFIARHSMSIHIRWSHANVAWFFDDEVIFKDRCEFYFYDNSLALVAKENSIPGWGYLGGSFDVFGIGGYYALVGFSSEELGLCFTLAISGDEEIRSAHILMTVSEPGDVFTGGPFDYVLARGIDSRIISYPHAAMRLRKR